MKLVTRRKSSNKGIIGASLIGVGLVGASLLSMTKKKNTEIPNVQKMLSQLENGSSNQMPSLAALTEFSKEITSDNKK